MYKWFISMDIKSPNNFLNEVVSTSHPNAIINISQDQHSCHIELSQGEIPTKDFVLIYRDNSMYTPDLKIVKHSTINDTIIASINFFPDFNTLTLEQARVYIGKGIYSDSKETLQSDYLLSRGEFIFIIDRSGSMGGKRIENAKKALKSFLNKVPDTAYFNVISYGSSFEYMFKESQSTSMVATAINSINSFKADFGGTEILKPVKSIID